MKKITLNYFLIAICAFLLIAGSAYSETKFTLNPYILVTDSSGDLVTEGHTASADLGMGDAFNKGNDILGVDFEIRNDSWSLRSQLMYTSLSDTRPEVPVLVFDAAKLDYEQIFLTEAIGYSLAGDAENGYLDLIVGARLSDVSSELELRGGPEDRRKYSDGSTWVDPLVGLYSMFYLGEQSTFRLGGDIGGFNTASNITWQAMAQLDFALSNKAWLGLGYRALSTDYEKSGFAYDVISQGPAIGLAFMF